MPLYEFKCRDCDHGWEDRIAWKAPLPDCPECGSAEIRKVYHAAALVFKGSGWHCTDYSSNGSKLAANGNGNGKSHSESGGSDSSSSTSTSTNESSGSAATPASPAKSESSAKSESPAKSDT